MEFSVIQAIVGSMIALYVFEAYLDMRQYALLKQTKETTTRSSAYMIKKSHLRFAHEATTTLIDCMILLCNGLPWLWKRSGDFVSYVGFNAENEILQSLAFLAAICLWSQIYELPFSLYSTFVIEAAYGCNKQTVRQFFRDWFLGLCVSGLLGASISAAAILLVQKAGPSLALYLWVFSFVMALGLSIVYPHVIAPLFNKLTPLPNGELRKKIKALAAGVGFPLEEIFVEDGSTRTTHSHAYMYGVSKKTIVLDDTLIEQCKNTDEIVALVAHEMGHWFFNHTIPSFVAVQIFSLFQFIAFDHVRQSSLLFQSFGFDTQPAVIGFYIFQHVAMPPQRLISFLMNYQSRSSEFEADDFVKFLGYGEALKRALTKLREHNLSAVNMDRLYSAYHYSHPPVEDRLDELCVSDKV